MLLNFDGLGAWKWPLVGFTVLVALFLLLPILFIVALSFGPSLAGRACHRWWTEPGRLCRDGSQSRRPGGAGNGEGSGDRADAGSLRAAVSRFVGRSRGEGPNCVLP
jgi:hypothetical protein